MTLTKLLSGLCTIVLFCSLLSCEGPTGPEGSQGPQGPQGTQGPQGAEGNANVVADTLTLSNADWLWNSIFWLATTPSGRSGVFTRYVNIDVPAITEDILLAGVVHVFMVNAPNSSPGWVSLPLEFTFTSYSINYAYEVFEGQIRLHYFHRPNDPNAALPSAFDRTLPTRLYKWVVIEGNLASQMNEANIDISDYNAVKAYFEARDIPVTTGSLFQQ